MADNAHIGEKRLVERLSLVSLWRIIRASEWWEYKVIPVLAAFYATALILDVPVSAIWREALMAFAAIVPAAVYASVVNDLTDLEDDLAAGKPNRFAGRSRLLGLIFIILSAEALAVISCRWRHDAVLLSLYLAVWLAFSLYSLPPFRLKKRGFLGILACASGEHLFPTLVAAILAFRGAQRPYNFIWLMIVGTWALANGIRAILWHQLTDIDADRAVGAQTFAARHSRSAMLIGTWIAFPTELLACTTMLVEMRSRWPLAAVGAYVPLVALRIRWWHIRPVIVTPKPDFLFLTTELNIVLLPIAILVASALRHRGDWVVLGVHFLIFPANVSRTLRATLNFARTALKASLKLARVS
ncbi:UbiA family prenyltransferase [Terriglobus albidus]|uniref:UbiA family prenyltransferase n=1 Tax=Terriglobus albidus TaxID=1592106 RepID=UPI0021DF76CF|nr:UbiA family prenyltransferase [Terriglobus albidus]